MIKNKETIDRKFDDSLIYEKCRRIDDVGTYEFLATASVMLSGNSVVGGATFSKYKVKSVLGSEKLTRKYKKSSGWDNRSFIIDGHTSDDYRREIDTKDIPEDEKVVMTALFNEIDRLIMERYIAQKHSN